MTRQDRECAARAVLANASRRSALGEATGILVAQGNGHAREWLREIDGLLGEDAVAARVVAAADARAEGRTDPDWI